MPRIFPIMAALVAPALLLGQTAAPNGSRPQGIAPLASVADYSAHIAANGGSVAAALIPAAQVKHLFAFDISKYYMVFEVAFYPEAGGQVEIAPQNFTVSVGKTRNDLRPSDPVTIAADIQQRHLPPSRSSGSSTVVASTEIGYESGTDPYSGRRVHDTYTASQVGVAVGNNPEPPRMPSPGGYPQDRELLENQLWDKGLPEGQFQRPVAGYIYFPASLLKHKSNSPYELEYLGEQKLTLKIPAK